MIDVNDDIASPHIPEKILVNEPARLPLINILLLIPFIGLLWVSTYNQDAPALFGFPFFYWYQFLWIPITVLILTLVYRQVRHDD